MSNLLNKGKQLLSNQSAAGGQGQGQGFGATGQQTNNQQEDYVDHGLDAFERKEGLPDNRGTNEKITDAARGQFEKLTGKNVPSKVSN